jgi:hypothetical protein
MQTNFEVKKGVVLSPFSRSHLITLSSFLNLRRGLSGRAKGGDDDGGGRKEVHVPYAAAEKGDRERERELQKKKKKSRRPRLLTLLTLAFN